MRRFPGARRNGAEGFGGLDLLPAAVVEERDAGAEGQEHDGHADADADAGVDAGAAFGAAAADDVGGDGDEELEHAAGQEPAMEAGGDAGGFDAAGDEPEDDGPEKPDESPTCHGGPGEWIIHAEVFDDAESDARRQSASEQA